MWCTKLQTPFVNKKQKGLRRCGYYSRESQPMRSHKRRNHYTWIQWVSPHPWLLDAVFFGTVFHCCPLCRLPWAYLETEEPVNATRTVASLMHDWSKSGEYQSLVSHGDCLADAWILCSMMTILEKISGYLRGNHFLVQSNTALRVGTKIDFPFGPTTWRRWWGSGGLTT